MLTTLPQWFYHHTANGKRETNRDKFMKSFAFAYVNG
jgi:hypothetical protein